MHSPVRQTLYISCFAKSYIRRHSGNELGLPEVYLVTKTCFSLLRVQFSFLFTSKHTLVSSPLAVQFQFFPSLSVQRIFRPCRCFGLVPAVEQQALKATITCAPRTCSAVWKCIYYILFFSFVSVINQTEYYTSSYAMSILLFNLNFKHLLESHTPIFALNSGYFLFWRTANLDLHHCLFT